jgi:leucyl-tRNA synthetase
VGSVYAFGGADVYGRFKRMQGHDVFEPIGLDGFGIHSENHAIKTNTHPVEHAKSTEGNFYRQLHSFGNSFAWDNKLETYSPQYYRWTQWLFVQLFKSNLAYRKKSPVNYCPFCKTVLADEQVIDGKCERCDSIVEKRDLEQWYFRITNYAERLLDNIEGLNWTEKVKIAQKNWIGKSEGASVKFQISNFKSQSSNDIEVFTTRPDTLHGATFLVLSPEHPLVQEILLRHLADQNDIKKYVEEAKDKSEIERQSEGKDKTGVFSGIHVINPVTKEEIPVWIADYVLMGYGTGAIMAVPAHDQRDFEFARKFNLPIKTVIARRNDEAISNKKEIAALPTVARNDESMAAYTGLGFLVSSGDWDGLQVPKDMGKVIDWLEKKGIGKREKNYHLRDWLISRQRYWGPPIPMIFCEKCAGEGISYSSKIDESMVGWFPVPEDQLPVALPYIKDYKPLGTGKSPLANDPEFVKTTCPHCGSEARRETDVSDTFLDSAWYFLKYLATDWEDMPFPSVEFAKSKKEKAIHPASFENAQDKNLGQERKEEIENWKLKIQNSDKRTDFLPVSMYIGGAEHSVLHLLYARFVTMFLHDTGYLDFEEPFKRFYAHGLIIKDGAKMSKSKGNVINPDEYIRKYGADTLRCYLQFLGPFSQGGDFQDAGIEGMHRFLKKVWNLFSEAVGAWQLAVGSQERLRMKHKTIKRVTEELENLRYNTAIAALMEWYNYLVKQDAISKEEVEVYLKLLAPFAPHMTEEIFQSLLNSKFESIHVQQWPLYDEKYLVQDVMTIALQVNGKLRGTLEVSAAEAQNQALVEEMARKDDGVGRFLEGEVKKVVYIPGKIINFVV